MSTLKPKSLNQLGFTLSEMVITLVLLGILSTIFFASFNNITSQYFALQRVGSQFSDLSIATQRIGNVVRGTTDFISVSEDDVTLYAYFFPNNNYVSKIRYYLNASDTTLYADVTQMSANPPIGTPVAGSTVTYTIIPNYYKIAGTDLFTFLDASGNVIPLPISDQHVIKGVRIVLAVPASGTSTATNQTLTLNVSLRNRKTNL